MLSLENCIEDKPFPLHNILSPYRNNILKNLKEKTIDELALDVKRGNSFLLI
jgi:hypothetical protein